MTSVEESSMLNVQCSIDKRRVSISSMGVKLFRKEQLSTNKEKKGMGFLVEKGFASGGQFLRDHNITYHALATIKHINEDNSLELE